MLRRMRVILPRATKAIVHLARNPRRFRAKHRLLQRIRPLFIMCYTRISYKHAQLLGPDRDCERIDHHNDTYYSVSFYRRRRWAIKSAIPVLNNSAPRRKPAASRRGENIGRMPVGFRSPSTLSSGPTPVCSNLNTSSLQSFLPPYLQLLLLP